MRVKTGILLAPLTSFAVTAQDNTEQRAFFPQFRTQGRASEQVNECWTPETPAISDSSRLIFENIKSTISEVGYQAKSIARFQDAVHIDTQVDDQYGNVEDDDRWAKFYHFSAFLEREFPLVHERLSLEKINRHGLVYSWIPTAQDRGGQSANKPIVLMAHQDTVPVSPKSLDDWKFDPFEGHIDDDGMMYGRGVHDDKNSLVSILESVELLLKTDFKPKRTVILAFGFDEEISGRRGALEISKLLQKRYGKNGLELILDEGPGISTALSSSGKKIAYASVATAEKGYLDVSIEAVSPGGHSSLAGKHSLIGIVSEMIYSLENSIAIQARISKNNPVLGYLSCNNFGFPQVPALIDRIKAGDADAEYALGSLLENTTIAYLSRTSQAIDLISGGQKINALPERVSVGINYRVGPDLTLGDIKQRISSILKPLAEKHSFKSCFFDERQDCAPGSERLLRVLQIGNALEPVRMSPQNSKAYSVVFGTVQATLGSSYKEALDLDALQVVPTLMAGNTDTRHYLNLTENIFRFRPTRIDVNNNAGHTVNEHLYAADHFNSIGFYASLILSANDM
ncbi:LAFA_0F00716g1_1 [Lachancea sp. 'fantastica']|nr:LAFA_0F00716g1_1 [Lachancea sp. 'fantastica']